MPNVDPPTDDERAALLHFEKLFGEWSVANDRALRAQQALWQETLEPTGTGNRDRLASEAARLREIAMALYEQVLAAHRAADR